MDLNVQECYCSHDILRMYYNVQKHKYIAVSYVINYI